MIKRDRDGTIYGIDLNPVPPPFTDKHTNKLHYEVRELLEVIEDLLERVYQLERDLEKNE